MSCRRDRHGLVKAGVTFEQPQGEPHACPDCAAKDAVILGLAERLACLASHLSRLAEREKKRQEPFTL